MNERSIFTRGQVADLSAPLTALRVLAVDFAGLPAPSVKISSVYPNQLELSLYDDLGLFETWRAALSIAAADVEFIELNAGRIWMLRARREFAGAELMLVGFGESLARTRDRANVGAAVHA
ncbi:hypothetical protein ACFOSC_13860 [Streptantibioticus rubrisoli]|uniref:Uncharacterized protein n=1 Tax=Streptantibioticus rubrisoli TaxID=1387313 RepID=A0ABT1PDW4_9ACTN|nr:hypothetical protein [Streptantibioticus rubrisoli]MCQ4042991.1 hypothetical protein [Streptantibioticus rubrisoli]